jgi:DNA-binding transcriptional LysR family regulator
MDHLRAMRVFARVADEGSFAGAARALDLAPAVVTRVVAELEEHLGARLMNRTTRRLALTDVGTDYLARVHRILADVEEATAMAGANTQEARGVVRLLMPPAVSVHQVAKHLPRFFQLHPQVQLEIDAFGPVEAASEAHDIAILWTRLPLEGDFIARRLARTETIICAAPEYLDRRGRPDHPSDLTQHDALLPAISEVQRGLTFYRGPWGDDEPGGESVTVVPRRPILTTPHVDTNYAAALAGLGITGLPSYVAEDALMEHALERILPEWHLFSATLWATMPSRQHLPARTRAVLDFLLSIFGGEDRDPWLAAAGCETLRGPDRS